MRRFQGHFIGLIAAGVASWPALAGAPVLPTGGYDLTFSNASTSETGAVAVSAPTASTRQFDVPVDGLASPVHVTLTVSAGGAVSGAAGVDAGSWQWTGEATSGGLGAKGQSVVKVGATSTTWAFDLEPSSAAGGTAAAKKKVAKFKAGSELAATVNK